MSSLRTRALRRQPEPSTDTRENSVRFARCMALRPEHREDLEAFSASSSRTGTSPWTSGAFAGKLSARGGGELSDDQMLALVVEGVTGSPMPETERRRSGPRCRPFPRHARRRGCSTARAFATFRSCRAPPRLRRSTKQDPGSPRSRTQGQNGSPRPRLHAPQPAEPEPDPTSVAVPTPARPAKPRDRSAGASTTIRKIDQRLSGLETKVKKQAAQTEADSAPCSGHRSSKPPERPKFR